MPTIFFLTTNPDKHAEIAALLLREANVTVEQRTARTPVPPSVAPGEVATFRALEAHHLLGAPVFAEALAIELADGLVSGASYRQAFEQPGGSSWLLKHAGATGIAKIAVGFTADGVTAELFETSIAGRLRGAPQGKGNAAWERFWIAEGGDKTVAELEAVRQAPYLALARSLSKRYRT